MCCEIEKNGFLTVSAVIFILLQSAVMADWSASSAFDYDGDGIIGLGDFAIFASHWGQMDPELLKPYITWISINDPGVSGHEGFNGEMSKYETTNAQFAQYLNDALSTGGIIIEGNYVVGNGGDYKGQYYYRLDGPGYTYNRATNGGKSRIIYSNGAFTVESGFGNHPVTYISWYGAMAFAGYYGWRLPTQWEWQAAADYDGSYTYGCGTTINNSIANYYDSSHSYGTTPVGQYGTFGYGLADMAGNVYEWTSSLYDPAYSYRILRGGCWSLDGGHCTVSYSGSQNPDDMSGITGFRVCR